MRVEFAVPIFDGFGATLICPEIVRVGGNLVPVPLVLKENPSSEIDESVVRLPTADNVRRFYERWRVSYIHRARVVPGEIRNFCLRQLAEVLVNR